MSEASTAGGDLVLAVFEVNGLLLAAGDAMGEGEGLTATRWQVLGAIAAAGEPLTVPRIARRMGLTRQSVQVSVNRLVGDGFVVARVNDAHARSPLIDLTDAGVTAYERVSATRREVPPARGHLGCGVSGRGLGLG